MDIGLGNPRQHSQAYLSVPYELQDIRFHYEREGEREDEREARIKVLQPSYYTFINQYSHVPPPLHPWRGGGGGVGFLSCVG